MNTSTCTIIVGMPRTATTVFIEGLGQHKDVAACGELFSLAEESDRQYFHNLGGFGGQCWNPGDDAWEYLDRLTREAADQGKKFVFKLLDIHSPPAWAWAEHRGVNLIYLRRDNPLECLVSERFALATGKWHAYGPKQVSGAQEAMDKVGPLHIEEIDVIRWLHRDELLTARSLRWSGKSLVVEYSYLSLLFEESVREALDFINLGPVPVNATQRRISRQPLWETVANYADLRAWAKGTFCQRCFPEPTTTA